MRSISALAAVAPLATTVAADFHIYYLNTISAVPEIGGGYETIFSNLASLNCDEAGNTMTIGWVGDASNGGARCEGCPWDADSIDSWDITQFEWKDDEVTTWNDGWITLEKNADDAARYDLHYVNSDRTESGIITNSYCERDGSTELDCTTPALSNTNVKKIFSCYTSLISMINP